MLRRSFMKIAGLFGVTAALAPATAMGNVAEAPHTVCEACQARSGVLKDPRGNHYFAIEEEDLASEMDCWFRGHEDHHDRAIREARQRVRAQLEQQGRAILHPGRSSYSSNITCLEADRMLGRPVKLTYA